MLLDLDGLESNLGELRTRYRGGEPFPHIVLDDFFPAAVENEAEREFPPLSAEDWLNFTHVNERKYSNTNPETWGPVLCRILDDLQSDRFVAFLESLTGIDGLRRDDLLEGGGLHQTPRGGHLNIHADYTVHPKHRTWQRRVNVILYLNGDWPEEYGGALEIWERDMSSCAARVVPKGNRVLIFNTDADSFHGHPDPLACPEGEARRSLALYYFTEEAAPRVRSTEYRARPGDRRAWLIWTDKQLVRAYDRLKRVLPFTDGLGSRVLAFVDRARSPRR
jgi:hypothetical protein